MNKVFMSKVNVRYFAEILRLMNQHDFLSAYLLVRQFLYEAFGTPREEALFLEKSLSEIYGVGEDAPLIPDIVFALITELALFMQYCLQILIGKIF